MGNDSASVPTRTSGLGTSSMSSSRCLLLGDTKDAPTPDLAGYLVSCVSVEVEDSSLKYAN